MVDNVGYTSAQNNYGSLPSGALPDLSRPYETLPNTDSNEVMPVYNNPINPIQYEPQHETVSGDDYSGVTLVDNTLYSQPQRRVNGLIVSGPRSMVNGVSVIPDREQQNTSSAGYLTVVPGSSDDRYQLMENTYADGNFTVIDNALYGNPEQRAADSGGDQTATANKTALHLQSSSSIDGSRSLTVIDNPTYADSRAA
jgi:hypothetical protein